MAMDFCVIEVQFLWSNCNNYDPLFLSLTKPAPLPVMMHLQSEEFVGDFMQETGTKEPTDIQVATKFAPLP
eukprot:1161144-Pelagomonas_calceolata.AAC.3